MKSRCLLICYASLYSLCLWTKKQISEYSGKRQHDAFCAGSIENTMGKILDSLKSFAKPPLISMEPRISSNNSKLLFGHIFLKDYFKALVIYKRKPSCLSLKFCFQGTAYLYDSDNCSLLMIIGLFAFNPFKSIFFINTNIETLWIRENVRQRTSKNLSLQHLCNYWKLSKGQSFMK